jgi:hypothetical protein
MGEKSFGERTRGKETTLNIQASMENNINMNLQEVGYSGMDWIELSQDMDRW